MKKYIQPKIKVNYFENNITTDENTVSSVEPNYIYAAENINATLMNGYGSNRATTTKIQNILDFN